MINLHKMKVVFNVSKFIQRQTQHFLSLVLDIWRNNNKFLGAIFPEIPTECKSQDAVYECRNAYQSLTGMIRFLGYPKTDSLGHQQMVHLGRVTDRNVAKGIGEPSLQRRKSTSAAWTL